MKGKETQKVEVKVYAQNQVERLRLFVIHLNSAAKSIK